MFISILGVLCFSFCCQVMLDRLHSSCFNFFFFLTVQRLFKFCLLFCITKKKKKFYHIKVILFEVFRLPSGMYHNNLKQK